jgi:site-specific recombinase XerD
MLIANRFATNEECAQFSEYLGWLELRGRRASTTRSYRSDWQDLTIWYRRNTGNAFESGSISADVIAGWRRDSERKGRSPSTILRRLAFARSYVTWLSANELVDESTAAAIRNEAKLKRADRAPKVMPAEDVHQFISHVDRRGCLRDQAIVYVLLDSGMRISELVELNIGDVDFERGELLIRSKRMRAVPLPTRAARKLAWSLGERGLLELPEDGEIILPASGGWPPGDRVLPPDPRAIPALRLVPMSPMPFGCSGAPSGWPLFVGERGRLSINGVQRVVRKHATFARVTASPQLLRHTFAVEHWAKSQDPVALAEVLGLESVESVKMYAQLVGTAKEDKGNIERAFG